MSEDKKKIEAILFTTGRFLKLDDLSRMCGIGSIGYLKTLLNEIKEEYAKRETALDIVEDDGRWKLNIRKEYLHLTEKLLDDAELDLPTQKTLAVVAYKQPAIQCDVVSVRGNKSYDHIRKLKEEGFVTAERFGRTKLLKLSQKFYDYFDVVQDELKSKFVKEEVEVGSNNSEIEKEEDLKESEEISEKEIETEIENELENS